MAAMVLAVAFGGCAVIGSARRKHQSQQLAAPDAITRLGTKS